MAPIVVIALIVFVAMLPRLFRGSFRSIPERVADVMSLNEREAIQDRRLLIKCGAVLTAVFAGFIGHSVLHIEPSIVALLGAGLLVLISGSRPGTTWPASSGRPCCSSPACSSWSAPWSRPASSSTWPSRSTDATGGNALLAVMLILGVSALLSGIIDNIPYVATMTPLVASLTQTSPTPPRPRHCGGRSLSAPTSAAT